MYALSWSIRSQVVGSPDLWPTFASYDRVEHGPGRGYAEMRNRRTLAQARDEFINTHGEKCPVEEAEQQIILELADGRRRAEGIPAGGIEYETMSEALWLQAIRRDGPA